MSPGAGIAMGRRQRRVLQPLATDSFAVPLRRGGAHLVWTCTRGIGAATAPFEDALAANGALFCPATPAPLLDLGPLKRGASKEETDAHDARFAELMRYRFCGLSAQDHEGYRRVVCPRPRRARSAARTRRPPSPCHLTTRACSRSPTELPRCCAQVSITVAPQVNEKTRQKHDHPYFVAGRTPPNRVWTTPRTRGHVTPPCLNGARAPTW